MGLEKLESQILFVNHATLTREFLMMVNHALNAHPVKSLLHMVFAQHAQPVKRPEMEEHAK